MIMQMRSTTAAGRQTPTWTRLATPWGALFLLCTVGCAVGCSNPVKPPVEGPGVAIKQLPLSDAPYALANDRDLEDRLDYFQSLALGDKRAKLRTEIADEYARRMTEAMKSGHTAGQANDYLLALLGLWTGPELRAGGLAPALEPYAATVAGMRKHFARSGRDIETATALYFLALAEPAKSARHMAEIGEIFAYADSLARAQYGEGAEGSRPITILETIVEHVSIPDAVERLADLYIARQEVITRLFNKSDRRMELIRAHGAGVLHTAWHLARIFGRAERLPAAVPQLARFKGIGSHDRLSDALVKAVANPPSELAWRELLRTFIEPDPKEDDDEKNQRLRAALELCRQAAGLFPQSDRFAVCAAETAAQLDLMHVAIRFYEEALARAPDNYDAANTLADFYRQRVSTLAFYDRPLAARERLAQLEAFHTRAAVTFKDKPLKADLAEAYSSMGQGMTSLGELSEASAYLEKSLQLRPTAAALEHMGTIDYKRERYDAAIKRFEAALDIAPNSPIGRYHRARILRLAGDALAATGESGSAADYWNKSIILWAELYDRLELPPRFKGELLIDSGKSKWALGDQEVALLHFENAIDADPDGDDTHSSVVSFLIVRGHYRRALDAYHRALGSLAISAYSKVYMSLWVLAESRRQGQPPDPLALEYLASRNGRLWYDDLARLATGRIDREALAERAHTRGQRAELLYYGAVLDDRLSSKDIRAVMQSVIDTDMVLFYEYEMAQYWLSEGFAVSQSANKTARRK